MSPPPSVELRLTTNDYHWRNQCDDKVVEQTKKKLKMVVIISPKLLLFRDFPNSVALSLPSSFLSSLFPLPHLFLSLLTFIWQTCIKSDVTGMLLTIATMLIAFILIEVLWDMDYLDRLYFIFEGIECRGLRDHAQGPQACTLTWAVWPQSLHFPTTTVCFLLVPCAFQLHVSRNKLYSLHLSVWIYVLQFELIIFCAYPLC